MNKLKKLVALYIASLRSLAFIHQQNHWTAKGKNFYSNHKLFSDLYESALENLDAAAEKTIGVLGEDSLDFELQSTLLHKCLGLYKPLSKTPIEQSLKAEKDFIVFSKKLYKTLEDNNQMTEGFDDLIMSIANDREKAVYLLQQTAKE